MNWYYEESGKQAGPVDDAGLAALVASGQVRANTLVWAEGMANWQPYSQVQGGSSEPGTPPVLGAEPARPEAVCAECNGIFPIDETVTIGGARVCAACKPIFIQKRREGVSPAVGASEYELASLWLRFAARIVDTIILGVFNFALQFGTAAMMSGIARGTNPDVAGLMLLPVILLPLGAGICYEVFFLGRFGATPGKMACGIRVVTADGRPISYLRALGRYFAYGLSWLVCLIGLIIACFDEEKRALHDRICDTRVVMK